MGQARDKDFIVNITKLTRAIHQKGFGLIMIYDTESDNDYELFENIASVGEIYDINSRAYKIASRIFGQNPRPKELAIFGNTDLEEKPGTKGEYEVTFNEPFIDKEIVNINGTEYMYLPDQAEIGKNQFTGQDINAQISNLKYLVNKYEPEFDVSSDTNKLIFAQKIAGTGDKPIVLTDKKGKTKIENTVKEILPTGMIAKLNQVRDKYDDAFFLVCTDNSEFAIRKLSNWIDTQDMMYFTTSKNIQAAKLVRSENTVIMYHNDPESFAAEGLASYLTTAKVGGITAKFKEIKGISAAKISSTQLSSLHRNNGFSYIEKMGLLQTTEGKATNGEYIDVVMGAYWIKFKMEEGLAYLAANTPKIGFDNKGIAKMVAVCNNVLKRAAFDQDIVLINSDEVPQYKIEYVPREQTDPNDVANRNYTGIKWTAKLAGAIHKATISGILEY